MHRGTRLASLGAILALVGAGCSTTPKATTVTVTATTQGAGDAQTFGFDAPAEFAGGRVDLTLVNEGGTEHEVQLLSLSEEKTPAELIPILKAVSNEGAPIPDFVGLPGGVNVVPEGASSTAGLNLAAGSYLYACFIDDHFEKGMLVPFTVTDGEEGDLPDTDASVTAVDYDFQIEGLTAGANTVTFRNDGDEPHFAAVMTFGPGPTVEEVEAEIEAFINEEEGALGEPEEVGGLAAIDPGRSLTADLTLEGGQAYVFLCFLSDRSGGPPHFILGMSEVVEVA